MNSRGGWTSCPRLFRFCPINFFYGGFIVPAFFTMVLNHLVAEEVHINADGSSGISSVSGKSYNPNDHSGSGQGRSGGNATEPTSGNSGGPILLNAKDIANPDLKKSVIRLEGTVKGNPYRKDIQVQNSSPRIHTSSRGGNGGDGGIGGNGEGGERGSRGVNATRTTRGTDGGNGYPGGTAGRGTSGANAGSGGPITIELRPDDVHLGQLFTYDVSGGKGGAAGRHGRPGEGGPGGSGGDDEKWETRKEVPDKEVVVDHENGSFSSEWVPQPDEVTEHKVDGGSDGSRGRDGFSATGILRDGSDGNPGKFSYVVVYPNGKREVFYSPSQLRLLGVDIVESPSNPSVDGIIEPGESIVVRKIEIRNDGDLFSPGEKAPVRFWIKSNGRVIAEPIVLNIPSLRKGDQLEINGEIPVKISNFKEASKEVRWSDRGTLDYQNNIERIQYSYPGLSQQQAVPLTYPVEISPIDVPESIAPGQKVPLTFKIRNISKSDLGNRSTSRRGLSFTLQRRGGDTQEGIIGLETENQSKTLEDAYVNEVPKLEANQTQSVQATIVASSQALPYTSFNISSDLNFQTMDQGQGQTRPIQTNTRTVKVAATYQFSSDSEILLLTNAGTTREEFMAWNKLAQSLGLQMDIWDMSYYGYLALTKEFQDQGSILNNYKRKTVVLLDDFVKRDNSRSSSEYLARNEFIEAAQKKWMNFYVVSSKDSRDLTRSLVSETGEKTEDCQDQKDLILKASIGLPSDVFAVPDSKPFDPEKTPKRLNKQALQLSQALQAKVPNRRFQLSAGQASDGRPAVLVQPLLESGRGKAVNLNITTASMHENSFVMGEENKQGLLLALDFNEKVRVLRRQFSEGQSADAEMVNQAVLYDIVEELDRKTESGAGFGDDGATHLRHWIHLLEGHWLKEIPKDEWKQHLIAKNLASIDLAVEKLYDTKGGAFAKSLRTWWRDWKLSHLGIRTSWTLFKGKTQAAPQDSLRDLVLKEKKAMVAELEKRSGLLVNLSDFENVRHLISYPIKNRLETTDDFLKRENRIGGSK